MNPRLVTPTLLFAIGVLPIAARAQTDEVATTIARARVRAEESRWQAIPWHESLTEALAVAQRQRRPVFLFGYDGIADTGLC